MKRKLSLKYGLIALILFNFVGAYSVNNTIHSNPNEIPERWDAITSPKSAYEYSTELENDIYTVILCHFEEDIINVKDAEIGITNGGWSYETDTPLVGTSSVTLAGENRNTIRWEYTPDLSEGTVEVVFKPHEINTDTGSDYIMQDSSGYWGLYLLDDGALKARQYDQSLTPHDLTSTYALVPDQIYHIAYTWGPKGQQIWVDGVLVAENQAVTIAMHSSVQSYGIGNAYTASSAHASWGTYDEFRVSTVQRTSFPDTAEFDDNGAIIVNYFEQDFVDLYGHSASSRDMCFTYNATAEDPSTWDNWVDSSLGGDWVTFNVNYLGESNAARITHVPDADPESELATALFEFEIPLENPTIETRVALGSNEDGYINFATYTAGKDLLQVVQFRINGQVLPYDRNKILLNDDITDSTQWLDIRMEIRGNSYYDLYINNEFVGDNFQNYRGNQGKVSYISFYGGNAELDFEAYCAYVKVEQNTTFPIEGTYSAVIDEGTDYARWYDPTDYTQGTMECFFKPSVVSLDDDTVYYILSGGDGTYPMSGVYMRNGFLRAYHYSANSQATLTIESTTVLEPGELYHIAYSFGPSGTYLYVNGVEENSSTDTRILHPLNRYIGIGKTFSLNSATQFSARGIYDLFRWSSVQRTSFPHISAYFGEVPYPPILQPIAGHDEIGRVNLTWSPVEDVTVYNIYRHTSNITEINNTLTLIDSTVETDAQDLVRINGTYYYAITAVNTTGESNSSNCESVDIDIRVYPSIPPVLQALSSPNNGSVNLTWAEVPNADYYQIYRHGTPITEINGTVMPIATTLNSYYENMVYQNITYYYVITTVNMSGESLPSNCEDVEVRVYLPPSPLLQEISSPNTNGSINLIWTAIPEADFYNIYRLGSPITELNGTFSPIATSTQESYMDAMYLDGTYYYAITTMNMIGESLLSNCEAVVSEVPLILQFYDPGAVIACSFENSLDDINNHPYAANTDTFITSAVEGNFSFQFNETTNYVKWADTAYYTQGTWECFVVPEVDSAVNSDYVSILSVSDSLGWPVGAIYYKDGQIGAHHQDNLTWSSAITYEMNLEGGQLYHFAYTFGPSGTFLYVDGELVSSSLDSRSLSSSNAFFGIGAINSQSSPISMLGIYDMYRFSNIQRTSFPVALAILGQIPESPILHSLDTPDYDGQIILSWERGFGIRYFSIYRHHSAITEINSSLTILGTTTQFRFVDTISTPGTYYYCITSTNMYGESSPSQTEMVEVLTEPLLPPPPVLYPTNSPDADGSFKVSWSISAPDVIYSLYRETSPITSLDGLTPIMTNQTLYYHEIDLPDGTYYYCVIAINEAGQSALSNIDMVIVARPDDLSEYDGSIPGSSAGFIGILMGLTSLALVQRLKPRRKEGQDFFNRSFDRSAK
jgi:fibronectin type 3 domain-containing protein